MNPFEDLIHELGATMDVTLNPDNHQSCLLTFPPDDIVVQIDLTSNADQILVGTELGMLTPGPYREKILLEAMRFNGLVDARRGILAYSEKNDTLVLFQFFPLNDVNGEKLHTFLQILLEHAKIWLMALKRGEVPHFEAETSAQGDSMFGLKP